MSSTDPAALAQAYAVLGLTPAATTAQVTRTFRRLVRGEHPDTSQTSAEPSGPARMRDLVDAYHTIRAATDASHNSPPRNRRPSTRNHPPGRRT